MSIGFVGVGLMGGPLARNLIRAGKEVLVFDLSEEAVQRTLDAGSTGTAAGSLDGLRPDERSVYREQTRERLVWRVHRRHVSHAGVEQRSDHDERARDTESRGALPRACRDDGTRCRGS